ncbi:MAG TPA: heterodisulfide reductase-related iron-sulfur binding cluster [Gemmatimonadaceae bacterium]|nr:heterodisulfide reductase-related iron-sulfur binding cluster [Gemmatimonadaceae bacterium]
MTGERTGPACAIPGTPLAAASAGINACVHCGFCLQACPTYIALGDENDSPRGRIYLMRALVEGELTLEDPSVHTHIDRCLGCRACETACPSGVPYGALLEATRATLGEAKRPPLRARLILALFARRSLMRCAVGAARLLRATGLPKLLSRLPGDLGFAFAMLAASESPLARGPASDADRLRGDGSRGTFALLRGCVMEGLFTRANRATERTLIANDYTLVSAPDQHCCGALHAHAGDLETARALARRNIAAFEKSGAEYVVTNAAGCGALLKEYAHLLADDAAWAARAADFSVRVRDVSELLAAAGPRAGAPLGYRVTYDAPCHLQHAQRVDIAPLAVLDAIPGLERVALVDSDQCCGSAGIYNLLEPALSAAVLAPKLAHIELTGAALVATGNPGCLMQIGAGLLRTGQSARTIHPVELLDASYAAQQRTQP